MNSPMSATRRGFTLIEVAVVLVSIALLAAIAIPSYSTFMDETDVRAARAEAELLVKNAAGVSSQDGYIYDCSPGAEADTVSFESALEQVDAEQGQSPYEAPDDQWVDFLGVDTPGVGTIQVIGERWTHYFLVDLCTGELTDTYLDPGGDGPALQLAIDYPDESFNPLVPSDTLAPEVLGGDGGPLTFSVAGDLPPGVAFDPDTGTFTGASEWNFKATQVSGRADRGCAVTTSTTVKCWGSNNRGRLGIGTIVDSDSNPVGPVDVLAPGQAIGGAPLTGVTKVAAGWNFTCALKADGRVLCWGDNYNGQVGNGVDARADGSYDYTESVSVAEYVVGVGEPATGSDLTNVVDIEAGNVSVCAVLSNGTTACWGTRTYGALGDGVWNSETELPYSPSPVPVLAPGESPGGAALQGVTQVSVGNQNGCALISSGEAVCWGYNAYGTRGSGQRTNHSSSPYVGMPEYVVGVGQAAGGARLTGVTQIDTSRVRTCAVLVTEQVACWGENWVSPNNSGILGTGDFENTYVVSPQLVVKGAETFEGAVSIEVMQWRTCAVMSDTTVECWGIKDGTYGSVLGRGYGESDTALAREPAPVAAATETASADESVSGSLSGVTDLADALTDTVGDDDICALTSSQAVYCFPGVPSYMNPSTEGVWQGYSSYPLRLTRTGLQTGFPATVTVTVADSSGASDSVQITISVS